MQFVNALNIKRGRTDPFYACKNRKIKTDDNPTIILWVEGVDKLIKYEEKKFELFTLLSAVNKSNFILFFFFVPDR